MTRTIQIRKILAPREGKPSTYLAGLVALSPAELPVMYAIAAKLKVAPIQNAFASIFGIPEEAASRLSVGDTLTVVDGECVVNLREGEYAPRDPVTGEEGRLVHSIDASVDLRGCKLSRTAAPVAQCDW